MTYRVTVREAYHSPQSNGSVILTREIEMPFPPMPGMSIGLEEDSDFYNDELRIKHVMWLTRLNKFLVRVEDCRFGEERYLLNAVRAAIEGGWRYDLSNPAETAFGAHGGDEGWYYIIRTDGGYFSLTAMEMMCVRMQGDRFDLVSEPSHGPNTRVLES